MAKNTNDQAEPTVGSGNTSGDRKSPKNPWTQNFVQIAQYLVRGYRDRVTVKPEFSLFQMPMEVDAVIVIQEDGLIIDNALMRSFKRHNIIEFKSPNDTLDIQAFDKTISYFYAYLSNERKSEKPPIGFNDVTLSIISVRKPIKVLKMLREERNYKIIDTDTPGIYYITKDGFIPEKIQLVVSSELPDDESDQSLAWFRSLRNDLTPEEAFEVIKRAEITDDHELLSSIVTFIMTVNPEILPEVKSMVKDPRVEKFFWDVANESGTAQKLADRRTEARLKIVARKMLLKKEPVEKVAEYTGLDMSDIVIIASALTS